MTAGGLVVGLTGGTGHIGGLLLRRLLDDPAVAEVRSVARRPLTAATWGPAPARLTHTTADLRTPAAREALRGVDVLFHLAAQVWQGRSRAGLQEMYGVNVEGTRNVVLAHPGAVVLVSSASVYGAWAANPLPMDEAHDPRPNAECPYAVHKLVAERTCVQEAGRWTVVRLAAVLGAHADARVARAVRGYHLAVPAMTGAAQAVQWLDEADAVEGLLRTGHALASGAGGGVAGEVVNLATTDWLGAQDVARIAGSRVVELPRPALIKASELGRRLGVTPFGADRAVLVAGPLALSIDKATKVLGWQPAKNSAQVLAAALERGWRGLPRNRAL